MATATRNRMPVANPIVVDPENNTLDMTMIEPTPEVETTPEVEPTPEVETIPYNKTMIALNLPGGGFIAIHDSSFLYGTYERSVHNSDQLDKSKLRSLGKIVKEAGDLYFERDSFIDLPLSASQRDRLENFQAKCQKFFDTSIATGKRTFVELSRVNAICEMNETEYFSWISKNNQRAIQKKAAQAKSEVDDMLDILFG